MSLRQTEAYRPIHNYLEAKFNQRWQADYQRLLDRLSQQVSPEIIQSFSSLSPIKLDLIPHSSVHKKPLPPATERCIALTSTKRRCPHQSKVRQFCQKHSQEQPHGRLDQTETCFTPLNDQYQMFSLTQQNGRKYYQTPATFDDYLPVEMVTIDQVPYLIDTSGIIYGITEEVPILGHRSGSLIKWYRP